MHRKVTIAVLVAASLFSASIRLAAAPCVVTNTPGAKVCQPGCCANKMCCQTSHKRTGLPVQPLAKSSLDQQDFIALAVAIAAPLTTSFRNESKIVSSTELAAPSPRRRTLLCTFLI